MLQLEGSAASQVGCGRGPVWKSPPWLSFPICTAGQWASGGCSSLSVSPAAELMERAAVPPLWPALYPPGRSSLHHAQQLQLFSQQHFLRQQEFLYLQQQAAQALELQRSAQLVVSWGEAALGGRGGSRVLSS